MLRAGPGFRGAAGKNSYVPPPGMSTFGLVLCPLGASGSLAPLLGLRGARKATTDLPLVPALSFGTVADGQAGMAAPRFQRGPEAGPVPRPGALEIEPYVPGSSRAPRAPRTVKLSSNESALGASPAAIAAYENASHALHRYPDAASAELRDALAAAHGVEAAQIVCGDGSDDLLHLLALGYAGPGDDVLFSEYGFVVYPMVARAVGARPRAVPERESAGSGTIKPFAFRNAVIERPPT